MDQSTIKTELITKTSRSSGSGGQHVNKVATKVEIQFNINNSNGLSHEEKLLINQKLGHRITNAGCLVVNSQATRSQAKNKRLAIGKLILLLKESLVVAPKRKKRGISKAYKLQRLNDKRMHSDKKATRKKINKHQYL